MYDGLKMHSPFASHVAQYVPVSLHAAKHAKEAFRSVQQCNKSKGMLQIDVVVKTSMPNG